MKGEVIILFSRATSRSDVLARILKSISLTYGTGIFVLWKGWAGLQYSFSALCKNQMAALGASVAVYVFPAILPAAGSGTLFRLATLSPLYHVLFVPIMPVSQIKDGILFAVFALPIAALFAIVGYLASCKIFAGHQVF